MEASFRLFSCPLRIKSQLNVEQLNLNSKSETFRDINGYRGGFKDCIRQLLTAFLCKIDAARYQEMCQLIMTSFLYSCYVRTGLNPTNKKVWKSNQIFGLQKILPTFSNYVPFKNSWNFFKKSGQLAGPKNWGEFYI